MMSSSTGLETGRENLVTDEAGKIVWNQLILRFKCQFRAMGMPSFGTCSDVRS
jgi:hypothetical protein